MNVLQFPGRPIPLDLWRNGFVSALRIIFFGCPMMPSLRVHPPATASVKHPFGLLTQHKPKGAHRAYQRFGTQNGSKGLKNTFMDSRRHLRDKRQNLCDVLLAFSVANMEAPLIWSLTESTRCLYKLSKGTQKSKNRTTAEQRPDVSSAWLFQQSIRPCALCAAQAPLTRSKPTIRESRKSSEGVLGQAPTLGKGQ
jgi:hypothetical protein